jgi:adenylate cyclase
MKRLMYFSRYALPLTGDEIGALGQRAAEHNRGLGVTGVLLSLQGTFFQVLEGDEETVDRLFVAIRLDERHRDVIRLQEELDVRERLFPEWSMYTIDLDRQPDPLLVPLKVILGRLAHAHRLVERYTQPALRRLMAAGLDPLAVPPRRVSRVVLFSDLLAFSALAERVPAEEAVAIVNRFFGLAGGAIVAGGGEVTKLIGDCVMATFPGDRVDAAVGAAMELLRGMDAMRTRAPAGSPTATLRCGVGLSLGEVIEGNVGSSFKLDFTVIGDVVNAAQRLEGLTRTLRRALVVSETVRKASLEPWPWLPLGEHVVKGRRAPLTAFTLDDPLIPLPDGEDPGDAAAV